MGVKRKKAEIVEKSKPTQKKKGSIKATKASVSKVLAKKGVAKKQATKKPVKKSSPLKTAKPKVQSDKNNKAKKKLSVVVAEASSSPRRGRKPISPKTSPKKTPVAKKESKSPVTTKGKNTKVVSKSSPNKPKGRPPKASTSSPKKAKKSSPVKKGEAKKGQEKDHEEESSSSNDNEEDSEVESSGQPAKKKRALSATNKKKNVDANKSKTTAKTEKRSSKKESSDESEGEDSSEEKNQVKNKSQKSKKTVKKPVMKKKKPSKITLAKQKMKQMQSLGFWGAPPRRAASLNAAAMVHCMYDFETVHGSPPKNKQINTNKEEVKPKPELNEDTKKPLAKPIPRRSAAAKPKSEDEAHSNSEEDEKDDRKQIALAKNKTKRLAEDSATSSDSEVEFAITKKKNDANKSKGAKDSSVTKKGGRTKKVTSTEKKKKDTKKSPITKRGRKPIKDILSESSEDDESEEDSESEIELKRPMAATKKRKKSLKDEFKMEIKDMIVKKRLASLNASAIMSASYAHEHKPLALPHKTEKEDFPVAIYKKSYDVDEDEDDKKPLKDSSAKKKSTVERPKKGGSSKKQSPKLATNKEKEQQHIIVEIEDERIKSQLIASAMKKAGKKSEQSSNSNANTSSNSNSRGNKKEVVPINATTSSANFFKSNKNANSSSKQLPPKKRKMEEGEKKVGKKKKKNIRVVEMSSSEEGEEEEESEVDDDEEIEEITTEGARANGIPNRSRSILPTGAAGANPMALEHEMHQIVGGGMYQVVHRFETMTTTAVVPRTEEAQNDPSAHSSSVTGKYTPLGALASLQPSGAHATRFPSTFQGAHHAFPQPGYYQPAGPLIRPVSPTTATTVTTSRPAQPPPTATVQPTVVSSSASSSHKGSSSNSKRSKDHHKSSSPVKPQQQQQQQPPPQQHQQQELPQVQQPQQPFAGYPGTYSYPTAYAPYPPPPPAHVPFSAAPVAQHPYPYGAVGYQDLRAHYPMYPPPPQIYQHPQGSYYFAPAPSAIPYQPAPSTAVPSASVPTTANQIALPGSYFYGSYAPHPYAAAAAAATAPGRMIAPVLALAPPANPMAQPSAGFPTQQTSVYSYSVQQQQNAAPVAAAPAPAPPSATNVTSNEQRQQQSKNGQAGSQSVGKGPNSQNIARSTQQHQQQLQMQTSRPTKNNNNAGSLTLTSTAKQTVVTSVTKSAKTATMSSKEKEPFRPILPKNNEVSAVKAVPQTSGSNFLMSAASSAASAVAAAAMNRNPHQPNMNGLVVGQTTILPVNPNQPQAQKRPLNSVPVSNSTTITPVMTAAKTKSSLRDYRKPKSQQQRMGVMSSALSSNSTVVNSVSMTPVAPKNISSSSNHINLLPVQKQVEGRKYPIVQQVEDLIPSKRLKLQKQQQQEVASASTSSPLQLPKGLTITEINHLSPKKPLSSSLLKPQVQMLPVHPSSPPKKPFNPNAGGISVSVNTSTGHPGLPNGLLRMASIQQHGFLLPQVATKVVPKDLKSQLALSRIGLPGGGESSSRENLDHNPRGQPVYLKPQNPKKTGPLSITMAMAKQAASAMPGLGGTKVKSGLGNRAKLSPPLIKQSKNNNSSSSIGNKKLNQISSNGGQVHNNKGGKMSQSSSVSVVGGTKSLTGSPNSSRSSSRNSSVSPRERSSSNTSSITSKQKPKLSPGGSSKVVTKKKIQPNLPLVPWSKKNNGVQKVCNGWSWVGEGVEDRVFLNNEDQPVYRICYDSMKHEEGDVVKLRDCILLASGNRKKDLPFIAKVTALWENPTDGDMMMSVLWYYRPEHLENGRKQDDLSDEIYASRHRDVTSVACIEDKCYVMTFNEYCRYRKFLRMVDDGGTSPPTSIVPDPPNGYDRAEFLPTCRVAPDRVFLCRRVYESRQRRLLKNPYTK